MKQNKIFLGLTILFSLSLFYFTACSEKSDLNSPGETNFESPQFAVIDFTDIENGVEDATLETNMTFNSNLFSYGFMGTMNTLTPGNRGMTGNPWMERFNFGKHLGLFFRGLNLTDAQKTELKSLMTEFHESMKPLVEEFRTANTEIIAQANADRKAIADQVKAGTLSRADAAAQLKTLNQATREKINSNPATIAVKAEMCNARKILFGEIEKILTPAQLEKWKTVVTKIPNPC